VTDSSRLRQYNVCVCVVNYHDITTGNIVVPLNYQW